MSIIRVKGAGNRGWSIRFCLSRSGGSMPPAKGRSQFLPIHLPQPSSLADELTVASQA